MVLYFAVLDKKKIRVTIKNKNLPVVPLEKQIYANDDLLSSRDNLQGDTSVEPFKTTFLQLSTLPLGSSHIDQTLDSGMPKTFAAWRAESMFIGWAMIYLDLDITNIFSSSYTVNKGLDGHMLPPKMICASKPKIYSIYKKPTITCC